MWIFCMKDMALQWQYSKLRTSSYIGCQKPINESSFLLASAQYFSIRNKSLVTILICFKWR